MKVDRLVEIIGADFYNEGVMAAEYLIRKADSLGLEHVNIVEYPIHN